MPLYGYKCPVCDYRASSTDRASKLPITCPACGESDYMQRVWSWSAPPIMQEHFNNTVGMPISSMSKFKEALKIKSEEATNYTGMEHNYQPVEWGDAQAVGATNEGIHESNVTRSKLGMPLLPEIK